MANVASNPSSVSVRSAAPSIPALLMSRSIRSCSARSRPAASRTDAWDAWSSCSVVTVEPGATARMRSAASAALAGVRQASTTAAPRWARIRAASKPSPVLAPVMTAVRPRWSGTSSAVQDG